MPEQNFVSDSVSSPGSPAAPFRKHAPQEFYTVNGERLGEACGACFKAWPCPSIVAREAITADGAPADDDG